MTLQLKYSKNGRRSHVNLPLDEIRALGWKKGDELETIADSKSSSLVLVNKKRSIDDFTYRYRKKVLEDGMDNLTRKHRRKLIIGISIWIHDKAKSDEVIMRSNGFRGNIKDRWRVINFLKKNRNVARLIGAHMNLDMLEAYESGRRKGLLPNHVLEIENTDKFYIVHSRP